MSIVERRLREDPQDVYGKMSFATRDRYRHIVEKIARSSNTSESEVAGYAVRLAQESWNRKESRAGHVGFYLIDEGREELERLVSIRKSIPRSLQIIIRRHSVHLYLGGIFAATALIARFCAIKAHADGVRGWGLALVSTLTLLVASQFVVTVFNWLLTKLAVPDQLPRMDFSRGVPPEMRTLVVVPTMLTTPESVAELVEALEIRFLANRDENVHFCLLSDFRDAERESMPEDEILLNRARSEIAGLNKKYSCEEIDTFFLLHRPRRWNAGEQRWMGYERKRGKLEELNSFLRGQPGDHFSHIVEGHRSCGEYGTLLLSIRILNCRAIPSGNSSEQWRIL